MKIHFTKAFNGPPVCGGKGVLTSYRHRVDCKNCIRLLELELPTLKARISLLKAQIKAHAQMRMANKRIIA